MKKSILIITLLLQICGLAQEMTVPVKMDSVFKKQFKDGLLMGNILVAEKGNVVYSGSFGYQDIVRRILNSDSSSFALASISKQFTSTAVLQLKEKKKLRLDDPVSKFLPAFPFKEITIRHLLTQTSGLPEYELFDSLIEKQPDKVFSNLH